MQQCPFCDKVYDESEYSYCPYCSGELEDDDDEVRPCPECGGCLHWDAFKGSVEGPLDDTFIL